MSERGSEREIGEGDNPKWIQTPYFYIKMWSNTWLNIKDTNIFSKV
jgi:hypothetical protein